MRINSFKGRQKYCDDGFVQAAVKNLTDNGDFSHLISGSKWGRNIHEINTCCGFGTKTEVVIPIIGINRKIPRINHVYRR